MEVSRVCKTCGVNKEVTAYHKDFTYQGLLKRYLHCIDCYRVNKARMSKDKYDGDRQKRLDTEKLRRTTNKQKAVDLLGGECSRCKLKFPLCVYDFHHLNPEEKDRNVNSLMVRTWARLEAEINKCVLLCSNCHRITHWGENN